MKYVHENKISYFEQGCTHARETSKQTKTLSNGKTKKSSLFNNNNKNVDVTTHTVLVSLRELMKLCSVHIAWKMKKKEMVEDSIQFDVTKRTRDTNNNTHTYIQRPSLQSNLYSNFFVFVQKRH